MGKADFKLSVSLLFCCLPHAKISPRVYSSQTCLLGMSEQRSWKSCQWERRCLRPLDIYLILAAGSVITSVERSSLPLHWICPTSESSDNEPWHRCDTRQPGQLRLGCGSICQTNKPLRKADNVCFARVLIGLSQYLQGNLYQTLHMKNRLLVT